MASMQKRLQKELMALQNDPPPGMTLNEKSVQNTITQWIVDMEGATGTLYEGEKFQLLFKFSSRYPFDSPQVMFMGENIPVHPHVYSNGHICLSILTEDWSPALSVQSVCLSIISMLSSCKEKRRPPDNSFYVKTCNKNPKKTKWWYHEHGSSESADLNAPGWPWLLPPVSPRGHAQSRTLGSTALSQWPWAHPRLPRSLSRVWARHPCVCQLTRPTPGEHGKP
uniref:N-terminal E2 ubiquitin-conjugating enzyme n=1 Tax=Oncorhynchus tshawytscha TaxID=74940 RepID=A0A8C8JD53_ONCTS